MSLTFSIFFFFKILLVIPISFNHEGKPVVQPKDIPNPYHLSLEDMAHVPLILESLARAGRIDERKRVLYSAIRFPCHELKPKETQKLCLSQKAQILKKAHRELSRTSVWQADEIFYQVEQSYIYINFPIRLKLIFAEPLHKLTREESQASSEVYMYTSSLKLKLIIEKKAPSTISAEEFPKYMLSRLNLQGRAYKLISARQDSHIEEYRLQLEGTKSHIAFFRRHELFVFLIYEGAPLQWYYLE
ncbi:MAG: hypothetical protein NZM25_04460 [Leptospiraceae bacterium]|nr:hypothetical protein [Leptospiraceae bacterium]MDW8305735.1 hypothetical protein [Leptospiraceae bacterium]